MNKFMEGEMDQKYQLLWNQYGSDDLKKHIHEVCQTSELSK